MSEDKPKLLILEDDDGLRRQYRWALSDYTLFLSGTRAEALDLMRIERPPLAVIDLGLPALLAASLALLLISTCRWLAAEAGCGQRNPSA